MIVLNGLQRFQSLQLSEYTTARGEHSSLNIPAKISTKLQWKKMFKSKNPSQLNLKWVISTKTEEENTLAVFQRAKGMAVWELAQPFRNAHTTAVDILSSEEPWICPGKPNPVIWTERQETGRRWQRWVTPVGWNCLVEAMWGNELTAGNIKLNSACDPRRWKTFILQGCLGKHMPFCSVRRSRAISWTMLTFKSELINGGISVLRPILLTSPGSDRKTNTNKSHGKQKKSLAGMF